MTQLTCSHTSETKVSDSAQKSNTKKISDILQLCSRCTHNEIIGWLNDREIKQDVKNKILQELKMIKLKPGVCIACKNALVADGTPEKIMKILEEDRIEEDLKNDFKKDFCIIR